MARYMVTGKSATGAVSSSTILFALVGGSGTTTRITLRKAIFGTEGATSFAQGSLEVGLYTVTAHPGSGTTVYTPLAQDSQGTPTSFTAELAWASPPTLNGNLSGRPWISRSCSVLSEANWYMESDSQQFQALYAGTVASQVGGPAFATIGSSNPLASGLAVTWTAYFDVTTLA